MSKNHYYYREIFIHSIMDALPVFLLVTGFLAAFALIAPWVNRYWAYVNDPPKIEKRIRLTCYKNGARVLSLFELPEKTLPWVIPAKYLYTLDVDEIVIDNDD